MNEELMKPEKAAEIVGYRPRTLQNLRSEDRVRAKSGLQPVGPPFRVINGRPRYLRSELEAWMRAQQAGV